MDGTVNPDSSVYYQSGYWNDLAQVRAHLNLRATGDPDMQWWAHLLRWHGKPFRKALLLNCGNGWVERDLVQHGVVEEAVGVDFIDDLLETARAKAAEESLPIRYYQLDTNSAQWPEDGFDLVVNFAAGHHIARLDRVFRSLAGLLPSDGVFVAWDYVGPHRNQYTAAQWEAAWQTNRELPEQFRQDLNYPHLATMIHTDPTEAIHAELILRTMRRYFTDEHVRTLGGAVGYLLLTFNQKIFARDPAEIRDVIGHVLDADAAFTDLDPERNTLFAYVIARPNKAALEDSEQLAEWTREEDALELRAQQNYGFYYPSTMIAEFFGAIDSAGKAVASAGGGRPAASPRLRAVGPRRLGARAAAAYRLLRQGRR